MKNEKGKDTRLLEALDYIDSDLIGETADRLMKPTNPKKRFFTTRNLALIAACLCLFALAIPVALHLAGEEMTVVITQKDPPPSVNDPHESEQVHTQIYDGSRGLIYEVSEDGTYASLVGIGSCTDADITVATSYNGLPVTAITYRALSQCETVESVTVPDTIKTISLSSFSGCPKLKKLYIGAGVETIRPSSFSYTDFDEIVISSDNPYYVCKNNCIIEVATKTLVFGYNGAVIPDDGSVEIIGFSAFFESKGIADLAIPEGIKVIQVNAFSRSDIASVTLPSSLEKLETGIFSSCQNLKYFDLGGYHELPDNILAGCQELCEVVGLENVTRIGKRALSVGDKLYNVKLSSALKTIEERALLSAESLGRIYFDGTVAEWNAVEKGYEWTRNAPNIYCNDGVTKGGRDWSPAAS